MLWILLDSVGKVKEVTIAKIQIHLNKIKIKSVQSRKIPQKTALLITPKETELREALELERAKEMRTAQEPQSLESKLCKHLKSLSQ